MISNPEKDRLVEHQTGKANWQRWGPYLSERAWGTVREDYSANGDAWNYFPHDHARSRAYRWNEDGIGGFCDDKQHVCLAVALWNEKDPILKERMFGLSNPQGNRGEDARRTAAIGEVAIRWPNPRTRTSSSHSAADVDCTARRA